MRRTVPLLVLLPLTFACATSPVGSAGPGTFAQLARTGEDELRVMTFNIQSGLHGLDAVAEVIRSASPDIVALQEVDRGTTRCGDVDQAAELAARTGLQHQAHFRATTLFDGDYGVALISRFPIVSAESYRLPTPRGLEPRTVAHVVLQLGAREVSVYVTHLTNLPRRSAIRAEQSLAIARLLSIDPRPKLVMGDLNDTADSPAVLLLSPYTRDVFARAGVGPAETYPLPLLPDLRLDYVLASRDFVPRRAFVLHKRVSDHYPLIADLVLDGAAPAVIATNDGPVKR